MSIHSSRFEPILASADDGTTQSQVRLSYLPALDGLRALAALVVLLYHADMPWMPGGFLGVEVFFVLSGFLITSLLLAEWYRTGRVNLLQFGLRRLRRLFPAMLLMVVASVSFAVLFLPDDVVGLRRDAVAGLGYVTNWHLIFSRISYFESMGRPSLLRHLWSLAIEGQLYVAWPLIFAVLIRRWNGRWVPLLAVLGAAGSTVLMALLYHPDLDPSRVYYGTDTRAAGFLLGALLVFVPLQGRSARRVTAWLVDLAGLASLGLLVWACIRIDAYQPLLYRGGFAVVAIATMLVIVAIVRPNTRLVPAVLGCRPLRWIGLRSYGIYLWHWPVFMLTRPQLDLPLDGVPLLVLRIALTLVLTELSYRAVEKPLRGGALGRAHRAFHRAQGARRWNLGLRWGSVMLGIVALVVVLGWAVANSQPSTASSWLGRESVRTVLTSSTPEQDRPAAPTPTVAENATVQQPVSAIPSTFTPEPTSLDTPQLAVDTPVAQPTVLLDDGALSPSSPSPTDLRASSPTVEDRVATPAVSPLMVDALSLAAPAQPMTDTVTASATLSVPGAAPADAQESVEAASPSPDLAVSTEPASVIAVGDSVMVSAADELAEVIDGLSMDAAIGRQIREVIGVLQEILDAGRMGNVVIIQVGNNGYLSAKKFDEMMVLLQDVPSVFILNVRVPRQWESTVNKVLAEGVQRYANATLIDWYAASEDHPEFFWKDGMHLRPEGAQAYTELIVEQLKTTDR